MRAMRRIRGALATGLSWAVGWAVAGVLIGVLSNLLPGPLWDSFFRVFDAPLPALGVPGFVGGVIFSIVLGVAGRRHKFSELSIPQFATWGAFGGLLLSLVPGTMAAVGLAHIGDPETGRGVWKLTAMTAPFLVALSAASAAGSLWLARKASVASVDGQQLSMPDGNLSIGDGHAAHIEYNSAIHDTTKPI
jgi:TctA family transporter